MAAPIWTPDLLRVGGGVPRSVLVAQKDQQKILDCDHAWPKEGIPNVPPEVLEGAKNFRTRKLAEVVAKSPSPEESSQIEETPPSPSAGTEYTWPTSPVRDRTSLAAAGSPRDYGPNVPSPPAPRTLPNTPVAESSPRLHSRLGVIETQPPSSSAPESEPALSPQVPEPVDTDVGSVNKDGAAITQDPTPPSAQTIPCTFEEPKRKRFMKPMGSNVHQHGAQVQTSGRSSPLTRSPEPKRSINPDSSRKTRPSVTKQGFEPGVTRATRPTIPAPVAQGNNCSSPPETRDAPITLGMKDTANEQQPSGSERIPPNGPPSQVLYTTFKLAYPGFNANLNDFIRGVLSVKHFRKKRALPQFLYDDFVRVFCGDYVRYITRHAIRYTKPLSAVEWYNEYIKTPVYQKGLLSSDNLDSVLDQYPDEVAAIEEELAHIEDTTHRTETTTANNTPSKPKRLIPAPPSHTPSPPPTSGPKANTRSTSFPAAVVAGTVAQDEELESDPVQVPSASKAASREQNRNISGGALSIHSPTPKPDMLELPSSPPEITKVMPASPPLPPPAPPLANDATMPPPSLQEKRPKSPPDSPSPRPKRPSDIATSKSSTAPVTTTPARRTNRAEEPPVVAFGKRPSLQADLLSTTNSPLSQQSNAESIADPRPRKRRKPDPLRHSQRWENFLKKQGPSSSIPGPRS